MALKTKIIILWTFIYVVEIFYIIYYSLLRPDRPTLYFVITLGVVILGATVYQIYLVIIKRKRISASMRMVFNIIRKGFRGEMSPEIMGLCQIHKLIPFYEKIEKSYDKEKIVDVLSLIDGYCEKNGIRYVLFNGIAWDGFLYTRAIHMQDDVDILVNPECLEKMDGYLSECGFQMSDKSLSSCTYRNSDDLKINIYSEFPGIDQRTTDGMLNRREKKQNPTEYYTFDIADAYISMLLTAYNNSESLDSNLCASKMSLRDYVDIYYFNRKYKEKNLREQISNRIIEYGLTDIAKVVLGNLYVIYDGMVNLRYLPKIKPSASKFDKNILERMDDPDVAAQSARNFIKETQDIERGKE